MDIKDYVKKHDREVREQAFREFESQLVEERARGALTVFAHSFEHRIGRPLSADERDALLARIKKEGFVQLADLVLDSSGPELAAWLEKNDVAKND